MGSLRKLSEECFLKDAKEILGLKWLYRMEEADAFRTFDWRGFSISATIPANIYGNSTNLSTQIDTDAKHRQASLFQTISPISDSIRILHEHVE
jgi:hypothetical protein